MEAAGLVLGVIPLAIQGLKTYRNILSSLRTAKRDLDCLIRDLETEQQILQNTCEILLKGIAPDSAMDAMIRTPLGANWDAYSDEVRLRLWPSATLFKDRIEDMREAAMELQRRLAIDGNGKYGGSFDVWVTIEVLIRHHNLDLPNWGFKLTKTAIMQTRFSDRSSILTEWKQNAHFSLNKKDYKEMLARLKDAVHITSD
ncbi:hypothetical protein Daus18300_013630 [Diaporthe australafricana]|uniref:Fungal N-terminal domain-containing protein n=1 Tax=Diaporthe australafricana TaxID=127596 RepID=A0ABR3VYB1_9PEZI